MKAITKALCCATLILVAAGASRYGVMDKGSQTTLFIVLPIVLWMTWTGRVSCNLRRKA